jgi:flagellar hook assembly protein FlgD
MTVVDPTPLETASWYRIQLRRNDGSHSIAGMVQIGARTFRTILSVPRLSPDGSVEVRYELGRAATALRLAVFDVRGRLVRTLVEGPQSAGSFLLRWDGSATSGSRLAASVYFISLRTESASATRKFVYSRP